MKNVLTFVLVFLFTLPLLYGQYPVLGADKNKTKVAGILYDAVSKEPISYAHVGIPKQGIGTTSGRNGYFELKVPERFVDEYLTVSFMGYKTYRRKIADIASPIDIYLEKASLELGEIVVADEAAVENIIRKAVKAIPKNYPTHPTTVLGFYREAKTNDSLEYIYLAEGVLNIYKHSYKKEKEGFVSLVQGRRINLLNPLDTVVRGGLTSGHMAAHRFDFVQNREDFINEKYFPVYKYWIENITSYNGHSVYIIGFGEDPDGGTIEVEQNDAYGNSLGIIGRLFNKKSRIRREGARMAGRIYIDKENYAFLRAEFHILPEGLKKTNDYPLYSGSWKKNTYVVNYRPMNGKYFFSDATREGILSRGNRYSNEVKITEINPEKSDPLPYLDRIGRGAAFSRVTGSYDPDFWANYNTTPLNQDLAESVQQLENAIAAQQAFDTENMLRLQQQRDSIYVEELKRREMERQVESGVEIPEDYEIDREQVQEIIRAQRESRKDKRGYDRAKFHLGLGTHLISSPAIDRLGINILERNDAPATIVSLTEDLNSREFEIVGRWDLDVYFQKNFFVRIGSGFDFYNSILKERTIGFGAELNLSKQRPFYVKFIGQYSNLRYARKLGDTDNDYGSFKVRGKKINSKSVNLYYGNRNHNLKLSAEISLEIDPSKEYYIRGAYNLPFARNQEIWIKERRQLFKKKRNVSIDEGYIQVTQNGEPYQEHLLSDPTIEISFGMLFK